MEKTIEELRIRLVTPEDREKIYNFFRQMGDEGGTFFNRNGGNERGTYMFLNGERPNHIYWAAVADTEDGEEIAGLIADSEASAVVYSSEQEEKIAEVDDLLKTRFGATR